MDKHNVKLEFRFFTSIRPDIQGVSQVEIQKIKSLIWTHRLQHRAQKQGATWAQLLNSQSTEYCSVSTIWCTKIFFPTVSLDYGNINTLSLHQRKPHKQVYSSDINRPMFVFSQITLLIPLKYELKYTIMFHSTVTHCNILHSRHRASLMAQI